MSTERLLQVIIRPIVTEKVSNMAGSNVHAFEVATWATKSQIAAAVKLLFDAKVQAVRTIRSKPQVVRKGMSKLKKKAYVTLAAGDQITYTEYTNAK